MSFLDHIRRCNSFDPARTVPLLAGTDRIGLLRRDNADALGRFSEVFAVEQNGVRLRASGDVEAVSQAVDTVVDALVAEHRVPKWRNETFDVAPRWGLRRERCRRDGVSSRMLRGAAPRCSGAPARDRRAGPRCPRSR